jgi:NADH-quinone oxidoreductase subunit A
MLTEFGKVFLFFIIGVVFVGLALITARILGPRNPTTEKLLTYECGEDPLGSPWVKFNIRFYVVALIFILFDVELVVLFPWALAFQKLGMFGYVSGALFIAILFLADFYLWAKGDLEWVRPAPIIPDLKDIVERKEARPITPRPIAADVSTQPAA